LRSAVVTRIALGASGLLGMATFGLWALVPPAAPVEARPADPSPVEMPPKAADPPAPASALPPALSASELPNPSSEASLMERLRALRGRDAARAIELAHEGNRRFPDSADAPERTSILIHALASLGQSSEARREAEGAVNHYPDSDWVREIEGFTGAHRHRNLRTTADGSLEYY
jgi:hypothetical protein